MSRRILSSEGLGALLDALTDRGYELAGPTMRDGVVRLGTVRSTSDLPRGVHDMQEPGRYETTRSQSAGWFGYAVGPDSLKGRLFPARRTVWTSREDHIEIPSPPSHLLAVVGARPCDVAAMGIQDNVLMKGTYSDPDYTARRDDLFLVVVNCTRPAATCFCASMGTGPGASEGFDIVLTELPAPRQQFLAEAGSPEGELLLDELGVPDATETDVELAADALRRAADAMGRKLDTDGLPEQLRAMPHHPRWQAIAERCLACANCTMVCPTCFCVTTEPFTLLEDAAAGLDRRWDSCFSLEFSYMGGESVRSTVAARYRQWLTHKLSTWVDQFGTLGCVGCGRCITWCPVGIDLTEEVRLMLESSHA